MKFVTIVFLVVVLSVAISVPLNSQTYRGTQFCKACHSNANRPQYTNWSQTLHSKIHLLPDTISIRPLAGFTNGDSIDMGSSYSNAKVYLRRDVNGFYATVGQGGIEYKIAWTYGWGYKQRYLVKIDTSYYILPIQYNLPGYLDNTSYANSNWASYNPGNWFNNNGTVKSFDNTFRQKSWDRNCMGCHVTAGRVDMAVVGVDTSWHAAWANNNSKDNIVVGCENCHGPYISTAHSTSQMVPTKLTNKDRKLEVCGQCHNRASSYNGLGTEGTHEYAKNEVAGTYFNPADTLHPLAEFMNFSIVPNLSGGPGTWPDSVTAVKHHQQYQEMLGAKHYTTTFEEIVCFTCHVSHKPTPNAHLIVDSLTADSVKYKVSNDDNTLCLSCHATHGSFTNIPKAWVQDPVGKKDSIGAVISLHTKHLLYDPENALSTGGIGRCTNCHMAKTATSARPYDITTHRFKAISPGLTLAYKTVTSPTKGMLNSCAASCHRNPSGSTASVPNFGITDLSLTDWTEASDQALADTLYRYWVAWGFPTSVKEIKSTVPIAYYISQNYPNPFNPSTKIMVDLSKGGSASLIIYNILGERVATLMVGKYEPGKFEVTWNGQNDFGLQAPSGVYFYKFEAGSFTETKKMILMK